VHCYHEFVGDVVRAAVLADTIRDTVVSNDANSGPTLPQAQPRLKASVWAAPPAFQEN